MFVIAHLSDPHLDGSAEARDRLRRVTSYLKGFSRPVDVVLATGDLADHGLPAEYEEGGTLLITGHGRLADRTDLAWYQQMVTIVRDRLQAMIGKGMTLDQVKAARPTRDFDPIYGHTTGTWTTDMFIEAAYKSLSKQAGRR